MNTTMTFAFKFTADVNDGVVNIRTVSPVVDRPSTCGICVENKALVPRLVRAIEAGAVTANPILRKDASGKTYVDFSMTVMGRRLNSDLKKLGY